MKDLAPIGISTYVRLEHLKQTVDALKNNFLADESNLYVFSDAPREGDEGKVEKVRSYVKSLSGFKSINLIERKRNSRTYNNREGIQFLLNDYGKMIWLEEDIATSKYFLTYMNEALSIYHNDDKVISISGYCPPIRIPTSYDKEVFLLKRFNAWGFGTWKHKFDPFSYSINKRKYKRNIDDIKPVLERYGNDVSRMVKKEVDGKMDALDVKIMYHQALRDLYTVYPTGSMTRNIGFDGTGLHCGQTNRFEVQLVDRKLYVSSISKEYLPIVEENRKFRNSEGRYFIRKVFEKMKRII